MADPSYRFVVPIQFTPNKRDGAWQTIGKIVDFNRQDNTFALKTPDRAGPVISFLSKTAFRVRFSPDPDFDYSQDRSYAVVTQDLRSPNDPPLSLQVDDTPEALTVDTGVLKVRINKDPYAIRVFRGDQLIHQDEPGYNLVYIPREERDSSGRRKQKAIANLKIYPDTAKYCGLGEKAGISLLKNDFTLTYFNYDNFIYNTSPIGSFESGQFLGGPLNPSEPLYVSIPFLVENNPNPQGEYAGAAYSYGIFFDNPSQSFINIGASDYSDMRGKYYFGALYGEMDYYFMAGSNCAQVVQQYTILTGRSPMPPKYIFGFHQGGYGYFTRSLVSIVANSYRAVNIPIDGLHIDVDFQNNYRTFTDSDLKFPNAKEMLDSLHSQGFKCSTNITPLLTANPLGETAVNTPYDQLNALAEAGGLLYNLKVGDTFAENFTELFIGQVSYGENPPNFNPFPAPGGLLPPQLGARGNYPNFELEETRTIWGEQYRNLIEDLGMDMIWQDMTDPALANLAEYPNKTFPLDLLQFNGTEYIPHGTIHNAYAINLLHSTSNGITQLRTDKRNFIISRGGYAGLQRYAGLWTGDSASSWEFLQINIPEVLNLGLSGVPISGCDIGGFANGSGSSFSPRDSNGKLIVSDGKVVGGVTDAELLTRWMHLGAFLPWYRNHYNGYAKQFQEVYAYGEPVISNCRKYVELRYRLIQVFYDAMYEWTQTGMPIARALFLNEPDDLGVYGFSAGNGIFGARRFIDDQFFVGKDLLVAPIVTPSFGGIAIRRVYLPAGSRWYAFKDNQFPLEPPVDGGQVIDNYRADLSLVPIYVRAGAILPMRQLEQFVGQLAENPLTINIYPGADSSYLLYQDDGITTQAATDRIYRTTRISHTTNPDGSREVRLIREEDNYQPNEPFFFVALLETLANSITINGTAIAFLNDPLDAKTPEQLAAQLNASSVNASYFNSNIKITFIKVFDTASQITIVARSVKN